ncbi:unnamed protein product [Hermetia illucens]|uniref:Uncharacterized protein n=1 Tax=Hermetia illucens TaxID=343691 RepID=A0A7R8UJC0_HERIL|nr:unnamed protein product [Hermetia illucens]
MKIALVFMAILAICAGHAIRLKDDFGTKIDSKDFLLKQKFIFDVLYHLHMPLGEEYVKDVHGFIEGKEYYNDYDKVVKFFMMYKYGLLPRNFVFSIFNYRHITEMKGLFYLFYYSRDWPTFYHNVLYARQFVNEGMFVYALYAAVIHRKDLQGIILPAHYEVLPYMYFNGLTIDEIMKYKTLGFSKMENDVVILSKYTDDINIMNEESKLSYFTEDIGWNMYYYFFNLDYPYWLGGKDFNLYKDKRGEQFLYMHQQLLARYYLERLSNKMGDIPEFSWYSKIKTGYDPHMKYYNGLPFTVRKNYYETFTTGDYYPLNRIEDFERRIRDAIDLGYIIGFDGAKIDLWSKEGIDLLGNLIQSNPDSLNEKYFGKLIAFAHKMLGGGKFYELFEYKLKLPPYKYDDLLLPGVKINKVDISKLVTYFDEFDIDVSTLMEVDKIPMDYFKKGYKDVDYMSKDYIDMDYKFPYGGKFFDKDYIPDKYMDTDMKYDYKMNWKWGDSFNYKYKVRQYRLNHKPFKMTLDVASDKPQTVVFRIYMGPKFDSMGKLININDNRENFVEIDKFIYDLKSGLNTVYRESREFYFSAKDRTMYSDLYKMVMMGLKGKSFSFDIFEAHNGFPDRLLLPKGWVSGMPMQFFFIITPFKDVKQYSKFWFSSYIGSGSRFFDDLPLGYPFDRLIDEGFFYTPNMYFKDVFIYHLDTIPKYSDFDSYKGLMYKLYPGMYNYKDLMMNKMDSGSYYKYPWMMDKMGMYDYKDMDYDYKLMGKKDYGMYDYKDLGYDYKPMDYGVSSYYKYPFGQYKDIDYDYDYKLTDKKDYISYYKYPWVMDKFGTYKDMDYDYKTFDNKDYGTYYKYPYSPDKFGSYKDIDYDYKLLDKKDYISYYDYPYSPDKYGVYKDMDYDYKTFDKKDYGSYYKYPYSLDKFGVYKDMDYDYKTFNKKDYGSYYKYPYSLDKFGVYKDMDYDYKIFDKKDYGSYYKYPYSLDKFGVYKDMDYDYKTFDKKDYGSYYKYPYSLDKFGGYKDMDYDYKLLDKKDYISYYQYPWMTDKSSMYDYKDIDYDYYKTFDKFGSGMYHKYPWMMKTMYKPDSFYTSYNYPEVMFESIYKK